MSMASERFSRWHDALQHQYETRPAAPAYSDRAGLCWSWADLDRAVSDLTQALSQAGVCATDRVLLLAENSAEAIATLFACSRLGAIVIPFNARQTAPEVEKIINHATPAAVVITSAISVEAEAHAARLGAQPIRGAFGVLSLLQAATDPDPDLTDVACILYTTGTTGDPKGVMLTHSNLLFGGRASAELRHMSPDDLVYGALPITHVFGLASIVTACAIAGAHVRLEARFSAEKLYNALQDGVSLLSAVPQMHALLMQYVKERGLTDLNSPALRYVSSGGAPLDPDWKRKAEAFYRVALQNGYGMTETTAGICATDNDLGDPDISTGPPLPGVSVRIEGDQDTGGDIYTSGPHIMQGYFRNPVATEEALREGWLKTGDIGRFDAQGHLHILGRSKELIIHGGFNVYPPEVEAALSEHPKVIQAAVIGHVVKGDEKVIAVCQVAPGDQPDEEDLRGFVASRLAGYKRPSAYIFASELPAAPTGKILKHKLRQAFASHLAGIERET